MGRIACLDFGKVKIGIAITDERRIIAQPIHTLRAEKDPIQTAQKIAEFLSSYKNIDLLVIGLPLLLNGKEGEMALLVKDFAKLLQAQVSYPIVFWDERLTSAGVEKMLIEMDVSRKERAKLSDALSAACILQNYLDALKNAP